MPTITETASQNARTVTEQSKVLADETVQTARQLGDVYQNAYLTVLEGSFQLANHWFEIRRVILEQSESASRERKQVFEKLGQQGREQQRMAMDLARNTGRAVQNTWLGVYSNGRKS